jgi:hypothetical protein
VATLAVGEQPDAGPQGPPGLIERVARAAGVAEVTWLVRQIIAAYAEDNRARGKTLLTAVIASSDQEYPTGSKNSPPSDAHCTGAVTTSWPTSTTKQPTGPPRPSTAASKPSDATPSGSAT